jgi:hypothetical protein
MPARSPSQTHFGWDATLDGVRYIQAPLSYPRERATRLATVATGSFPEGKPPMPILVYDALAQAFPPRYDAGWSNWYRKYPRRPDLNHLIPPYVADNYKQIDPIGKIGWLSDGDVPEKGGSTLPAWAVGPPAAVEYERRLRAAAGSVAPSIGRGWEREAAIRAKLQAAPRQ